jgi:pimeloyl-ACP methyl ester carboxylesterase
MTAWVLLRGLVREAGHWGRFTDVLQARFDGMPAVAVDLPGNGSRHAERSPTDIRDMVMACRASLREQGVAPPYRLLAMSLGAMVATAWANRHPEEVLCAVLINTSMRGFGSWHQRLRAGSYVPLLAAWVSLRPTTAERAILGLTSRHPSSPAEAVLAQWTAIRRQRPVHRLNALRQLWAAARFRGPDVGPPVPVLVMASAGDALVDPRCSALLALAWRADLVVHPTAGHDLPLDDPQWVTREIGDWLERRPRSPE